MDSFAETANASLDVTACSAVLDRRATQIPASAKMMAQAVALMGAEVAAMAQVEVAMAAEAEVTALAVAVMAAEEEEILVDHLAG